MNDADRHRQRAMNAYLGKFKEREMDDLERLARELHNAPHAVNFGSYFNGSCRWSKMYDCPGKACDIYLIDKIKTKRDDLSGKPKEWVNDWARWKVQQIDGFWFEYEKEPKPHVTEDYWVSVPGSKSTPRELGKGEVLGDWRNTLEERVMEDKAVQDHELDGSEAVEWIDGLPPFGEEAECRCVAEGPWQWCRIKAYDDNEIWMTVRGNMSSSIYRREVYEFRPIKTPKERAIEEMSYAVSEALRLCVAKDPDDIANILYNNFKYRKQE